MAVVCELSRQELEARIGKNLALGEALAKLGRMILDAKRLQSYGTFSIRLSADGVDIKQETVERHPC